MITIYWYLRWLLIVPDKVSRLHSCVSEIFACCLERRSFSLTGSGVTTVGLALFAYQLTGGASATAVIGNVLTLRILAFLLFSQPSHRGSSQSEEDTHCG
jgi:hypothetical protein